MNVVNHHETISIVSTVDICYDFDIIKRIDGGYH